VAFALLASAVGALASPPVRAEEAEVESPSPLSIGPALVPIIGPWRPPEYAPDEKDWLQLTSGEWVGGTIELISDETVYFDSDELDDLEIDWDDVSELRSARRNTYRFTHEDDDEVILTGTAGMRGGVIRIDTGEEILEFPRDELLNMIEGGLRELDYWSLNVGLGLSLRSGNSDQTDLNINAQIRRETPLTRATVSYQSAYSEADGDELTNNQRLNGEFNYYVSRRFYVVAPLAEAFRDRLQNIELRTTVGAGVGYDILDRPRADWNVLLGGGYQRTDYHQIEQGLQDPEHDAAVIFGSTLELDPWKDVDWDTTYQLQLIVTDLDKTNHHLTSVFSFDIWGPLDLDVTFTWDRIEGPTRDEDGQTPKKNDYRMTVGLAIDL